MRTLLLSSLLIAALVPLLTACETCTSNGERRCGDGEVLTCVDSPDATSSFDIATPCDDVNPTCVEDATAYPPAAACVVSEGQDGCGTCLDARRMRSCSTVGVKSVVIALDCRTQFPDPSFPGICDPSFNGCRQCNPGVENCDGSCTPGETRCLNGMLARCLEDGSTWNTTSCAYPNGQCIEDTGVTPRVAACVNQAYSTSCGTCSDNQYELRCENVGNIQTVIAFDCQTVRPNSWCDPATARCVP